MRIANWIRRLLAARRRAQRATAAGRHREDLLFPPLFVRQLEPRRVLNGTFPHGDDGEDLVLDAGEYADDGDPDTFLIARDGDDLHVSVDGPDGMHEVYSGSIGGVSSITIAGSHDDDRLIVDLSGGDPE